MIAAGPVVCQLGAEAEAVGDRTEEEVATIAGRERSVQCEQRRVPLTRPACLPLRVGIVPLFCLMVTLRQIGYCVMIGAGLLRGRLRGEEKCRGEWLAVQPAIGVPSLIWGIPANRRKEIHDHEQNRQLSERGPCSV